MRRFSMKKIALIYLGRRGGAVPYSFEMTKALLQKGVEVFCILSEHIQNRHDWEKLSGENRMLSVSFLPTYTDKIGFIKSFFVDKPYKDAVMRVREFAPYALYLPMISLNARKLVRRLSDIPLITTIHDFTQHLGDRNFFTSKISEYISKRTDKFVVLTGSYAPLVAKKYGKPMEAVAHIPHANFSYYNLDGAAPRFDNIHNALLFFGRISKYKGVSVLLRSMRILHKRRPELKLVIAGSGNLTAEDMSIINSMPDNISLMNGWLPDTMVWELFAGADMTIVPYIDASQSGVVAISFSSGRTVVATDVGGLREQVEPGGGIVIPPNDPERLADVVDGLYADTSVIVEHNKRAYEYAVSELTWERSASLLLDLIYNR